jgi:hypothetical protein
MHERSEKSSQDEHDIKVSNNITWKNQQQWMEVKENKFAFFSLFEASVLTDWMDGGGWMDGWFVGWLVSSKQASKQISKEKQWNLIVKMNAGKSLAEIQRQNE